MGAVRTKAGIAALCGAVATLACAGDAKQAKPDGGGVVTTDGASADQPVTGGVSFANDVYPIIAASCAVSTCHDMGITTNHWNDYTTADKTYTRWVNGPGFDFCVDTPADGIYTSRVIVVPGDPDGSYLITKIAPPTDAPCQDPTHHRRMPPDPRPPLPQTSIDTIVQWIREGALQN